MVRDHFLYGMALLLWPAGLAWVPAMAPAGAEPVVLDCGNPRVVAAENPAVPCPTGGAAGGLDAGYPGDEAAFLLSRGEAGKQYYGSPDSL